jgi:5'-nucleotidase
VTVLGATGQVLLEKGKVSGPVSVTASGGGVRIDTITASGPMLVSGNSGTAPVVVAANKVSGPLACLLNTPAPVNESRPNTVRGPATGQCAGL